MAEKSPVPSSPSEKKPSPTTIPTAKLSDSEASSDHNVTVRKPKVPPVPFRDLFRYASKFELCIDALSLVAAAAAGVAQPALTLIFGRLVQNFIDFGTLLYVIQQDPNSQNTQQAFEQAAADFRHAAGLNASYLVYIGMGMFVCSYIYMMVWGWTSEILSKRIREHYLYATLRQDIAFFDDTGAGEIATRIQTDTDMVQKGVGEKVALIVVTVAAFLSAFVIAYVQEWRLALALSSILPIIFIAGGIMNRVVSKDILKVLGLIAQGGTIAEEAISSIRTVQAFNIQDTIADAYKVFVIAARERGYHTSFWLAISLSLITASVYASYALAFYFGTSLIIWGYADPGTVINVIFAILVGSFSIIQLAAPLQAIQEACGAAAKLYSTIDRTPSIDSYSPEGLKPKEIVGDIKLQNIHFHYPSRPNVPVMQGVSLHFKAGTTSAIVGTSGSGKSTVISLIERFYDPLPPVAVTDQNEEQPSSSGVFLDGIDIRQLNVQWLRSQIGLVSQEPTLFNTSVAMNVAHGLINTKYENLDWEGKMKMVKVACEIANAHGFVEALPNGYDTMVGERAILLSGGQKQRIAIARAIVSDPRILLLDEATSALDTQNEGIVQDALDKAAAGRTTITIAHRLSTIMDANIIYVMGEGKLLEQGTHDELVANQEGAYHRLVQAQKLRESTGKEDAADSSGGDGRREHSPSSPLVPPEDEEKEEQGLHRTRTSHSLGSQLMRKKEGEEESKGSQHSTFRIFMRMIKLNRMSWRKQIIAFFAAVVAGAAFPVYGIVFAQALQGFSEPDDHDKRIQGNRNALWLFIIAIVAVSVFFFQTLFFVQGAANLMALLREHLMKSIMRQDVAFFDLAKHSTGALVSQLSQDPQKVNGFAGMIIGTMTQATSTLVIGYIVGCIYAWKIGLVGIACTPLVVGAGILRLHVIIMKDKRNKLSHAESAQVACEAAASIRTVAALTREKDCLESYSKVLDIPLKRTNRANFWGSILFAFAQSVAFWVLGLVFWFGAGLVSRREINVTEFFVGLMSTTFASIQVGNLFNFSVDMSEASTSARSIVELFDSMPEIDAKSPDGKTIERAQTKGKIAFRDVHFRYPSRPSVRVLSALNLEIEPGTYVALVGASGCGKSTTIQLVERFYDPVAGCVLLDDVPLTDLNIASFRNQMSLVSQEPTLYAGTIRFNILLGANKPVAEVTQKEIEQACRDANILDFIESLPDRFDTQVGGKGSQLSGGQKQRIAIARALLRDPKVLLLDEATSALDSTSEKVVQAALDNAAKGRTTIAIAHRLSTIQNADRIYFLKEGRVSEWGTHDQLIQQKGDYYEFVQLQALSKAG